VRQIKLATRQLLGVRWSLTSLFSTNMAISEVARKYGLSYIVS